MADGQLAGEIAGYRPVSGLAVAALFAGCGSALVLFTSLAAVLPLVAVVMAGAALVDLRRAEGRRVGRPLALVGLALAIGFTSQAIAAGVVDAWIARGRAAATVAAWIDAVREERFADAAGLCIPAALPAAGGEPLPGEGIDRLAAFRALRPVAAVAACGDARPPVAVSRGPAGAGWIARIDLAPCGRPGTVVTIQVEPRTAVRGPGTVDRWLVTGLASADG